MSGAVTVRAPAKINLKLAVGPPRGDGYHPLTTVYQAIGLYDDVTVTEALAWTLSVTAHERIDVDEVPVDGSNVALRAGRMLADHHGLDRAASIEIDKGIPVAGGLAGGSADAAATLLALDRLWDLRTPDEVLLDLAAQLGSDVPFALYGGTALGQGRGEQVTPLSDGGSWWWVIVESDEGLSTPRVYAEFDRLGLGDAYDPSLDALSAALDSGDPERLAGALSNDLTAPALTLRPDLRGVLDDGVAAGALAGLLSGSGPTCLFLCADAAQAAVVRGEMGRRGYARVSSAPAPVAGCHVVEYA